jgi:hypothetical protein
MNLNVEFIWRSLVPDGRMVTAFQVEDSTAAVSDALMRLDGRAKNGINDEKSDGCRRDRSGRVSGVRMRQ